MRCWKISLLRLVRSTPLAVRDAHLTLQATEGALRGAVYRC